MVLEGILQHWSFDHIFHCLHQIIIYNLRKHCLSLGEVCFIGHVIWHLSSQHATTCTLNQNLYIYVHFSVIWIAQHIIMFSIGQPKQTFVQFGVIVSFVSLLCTIYYIPLFSFNHSGLLVSKDQVISQSVILSSNNVTCIL